MKMAKQKPSFLSEKKNNSIKNKNKIIHVLVDEDTVEDFELMWTAQHQKSYERVIARTGEEKMHKRMAEFIKSMHQMHLKQSKIVSKYEKMEQDQEVDFIESIDVTIDVFDIINEGSMIFYDLIHAFGMAEYPGEWSHEDTVQIHTGANAYYSREEFIALITDLFISILGGELKVDTK